MLKHRPKPSLEAIIPPTELEMQERVAIFDHVFRKLAIHRSQAVLRAIAEEMLTSGNEGKVEKREEYEKLMDEWANVIVKNAWDACHLDGGMSYFVPFAVRVKTNYRSQSHHD